MSMVRPLTQVIGLEILDRGLQERIFSGEEVGRDAGESDGSRNQT